VSVHRVPLDDPRLTAAANELRDMILSRFPGATFEIGSGDDPFGLYLVPTVDVEDTEDVSAVVMERLLSLQDEEELPIYVFPVRPIERVLEALAARSHS
jgi:hypothetical protein